MMSTKYSVIIVPDRNEPVVNKQFSKSYVYAAAFVMITFVALALYFAYGFISVSVDEQRLAALTGENIQLTSKITELESTVHGLRAEMSNIIRKDDYIRLIFDLPSIDQEMREVGIGGEAAEYPPFNSDLGQRTWLVEEDIEKIQRQL